MTKPQTRGVLLRSISVPGRRIEMTSICLCIKQSGPRSALASVQTHVRELVLGESKRRWDLTQDEHTGVGGRSREGRVTRTESGWEGGCLYSEGSSRAAGHQSTDKPDVEHGGRICCWHHFSNSPHPAIPHFLPKSSLARKFTQCCSSLPSCRRLTRWCPRGLPSCCALARGCSLGA